MTRDDLYRHYRTHYAPNNAIVAVAGDFNAGEMTRIIERAFGKLEPVADIPQVTAVEPLQAAERRVSVAGAAGADYLAIAYHVPAATHPDFYALTVLSTILAGSAGSLVGRGSLTNRTSRLYKAVVARELAADVGASLIQTVDPGLYRLSATILPGHTPAEVEALILTEIEQLQHHAISADELAKAKRQARALFAYSSESITNQGFWLGFSEIFANYTWFMRYLHNLDAVTVDDVLRVAQTYLQPANRTVGWYLSCEGDADA